MERVGNVLLSHPTQVAPVIRFACSHCGTMLSAADSKANTAGTCPYCEGAFRVPGPGPVEKNVPTSDPDNEEVFEFSRSRMRYTLIWMLCFQALSLVVGCGCVVGCVYLPRVEPVSLKMIATEVFSGLVAVVAFCYLYMCVCSWKLFFFSTIPSSAYYLLTGDRLQRYSRAGELVEEIPYANIAELRLVTKRDENNPDVKVRVLGITLHDPADPGTVLDDPFVRWSQQTYQYDVVLIEDFLTVPIKGVRKKLRKSWQQWQDANPRSSEKARSRRSRRAVAWYQQPWLYVLGLGLAAVVTLAVVLSGQRGGQVAGGPLPGAGPAQGPGVGQPQGPGIGQPQGPGPGVGQPQNDPPQEAPGPNNLPGLIAHWPLDEGRGEEIADAVGNGPRGRLRGAAWVRGVKGTGVRLNGKGDYVELGTTGLQFARAASFTVVGWVTTESTDGVICSFRSQLSNFPVIELSVRKGQLAGWVRDDTSGQGGAKLLGAQVSDGKWHHVALLRQSDGTMELFLDGASQGRDKGKSSVGPITTNVCVLGCDRVLLLAGKASPAFLAGSLDEFCVFNRPLTAPEIAALMRDK